MKTVSLLALALTSCTDAEFYLVVPPLPKQSLTAQVCAPDSLVEQVPYKVLFVVDTSMSNVWTDPELRRVAAVNNVVDAHKDKENVFFGVITFSDVAVRQTYGFTRDLAILNGAIENIGNAQGGTNYSETLWTVIDFITADLSKLGDVEARRTHYLVYWLSDGFPTVGVTDRVTLVSGVSYLRDLLTNRVAEFAFNTGFLCCLPPDHPDYAEVLATAPQLLGDMAADGNGAYANFDIGEQVTFSFAPQPLIRDLTLSFVEASNAYARFGPNHPEPDSDADGLTDEAEADLALDPLRADSDGDGFRDGVEVNVAELDATRFDAGCESGDADSDGDGLRDCEEIALGTSPQLADSDGDYFVDGLEWQLGTSLFKDDPGADLDYDGMSDDDELLWHLAPRQPNSGEDKAAWAYRYNVPAAPSNASEAAAPCYDITVDNLSMFETLRTDATPRGFNAFAVYVAFEPTDGEGPVLFKKAEYRARLLLPNSVDPPTGALQLHAGDFTQLR